MPISRVEAPDGRVLRIEHPVGATPEQILSFAQQSYIAEPAQPVEEEEDFGFFDATGEALKRAAGSLATSTTGAVLGLGQFTPFDDEALALQESIEENTRDALGYDPAYDGSTAAQIGEVTGNIASFLIPGTAAGKLLNAGKVAKTSIAAGQGAGFGLTVGAKERQAAEERGIDISGGQEALAKISDAGIGSLEAFGLPFRVFRGLPRGFFKSELGKTFQDRIESMVAGGLQEGIQEAGAGIARDIAALNIYDPDRQVADSAIEDFTVGGIAGGVLDLALGSFGKKVPTIEEQRREEDMAAEVERRARQEEFVESQKTIESARKAEVEARPVDTKGPLDVETVITETVAGETTPQEEAKKYRDRNNSDISRAELEIKFGPIEDAEYESIVEEARGPEQAETPILALPSPDSRKLAAQKALQDRLGKLNLSDKAVLNVVDVVRGVKMDEQGNLTFESDAMVDPSNAYGTYQPSPRVIQLSIDQVIEDAKGEPVTEEMVIESLTATLNHEVYHALRHMDLVTQEEVDLLERLAKKYQKTGETDKDGKPMSYGAWASDTYKGTDSMIIAEESVAEMISDALAGKLMLDGKPVTIGGKPRNIIQKIVDFFKEMAGFTADLDARNFSDFLGKLESGDVGARSTEEIRTPYFTERDRAREQLQIEQGKIPPSEGQAKSDAPILDSEAQAGDVSEEVGDESVDSRRVGRPDTGARPEVAKAYQDLTSGKIDRNQYDQVVLGTVSEYDFVPQPATRQEMFNALDKNKKEKIGLPIEENTEVGLRLDIPAYTNHGVWVPTIHSKGKASHRATAAINNADFTKTSQGKAQKVMEGGAKSPFAQIKGSFVDRTDAENEAIAQQALNDPAWTQVGFDPRRHSYFYDRKTGEAVTKADEVVQVGPLVLAKNAVKDPVFQEETLYSKRPDKFTSVSFEIAPDPNNKPAVNRWNQMSEADKYSLSNRIGSEISEQIIEDTGALANVRPQVGSYKDATNPSYAIKVDAGNPVELAQNLGFVLDQESMSIMSSENFDGAFKSNAVDIDVGDLDTFRIKEIYDTLRNVEGVPQITGQSTLDGNMLILLDQDANPQAVADAFDKALDGKYDINYSEIFASFPEKPEYDYASLQVIPRKNGEDFRQRYLNFRSEAQGRIDRAIGQITSDPRAGRGNARNYDRTFQGAVRPDGKIILSHYSTRRIPELDPSKAGTGADRTKRNRPTRGAWLGITQAIEDPYVKEGMLGNVETRFAMDLGDLYVMSDPRNPEDLRDPHGVWTTWANTGAPNYDEILRKVSELGYKGFVINSGHFNKEKGEFEPNLGKIAVVNEKLLAIDEPMQSRRPADRERLVTRKREPQKVEEAVIRDEILAAETQGFPRVSFTAEPDAQYVAQNPEAGYSPLFDEEALSSRRSPSRSASYQSAMNDAVGERPAGPSQFDTYMEATGEGKLSYWLTKFKQGAINRYARLEALQKDPRLKDNLADSSSIAGALFSDRARGIVASAIKYGVPVYRGGITKVEDFVHNNKQYRGLVDLMSMLYSKEHGDLTKDAQAYAIAIRGGKLTDRTDKNGNPLKAPLTPEQRQEIIDNAESYVDANGNSIIKEWYSAWQAYNNYTIRFLRDTGVLNEETAKLWQESSDYIPFYRAAAGEKGAPALAQRVFGDLTSKAYIKEYKGSESAVDVPLMEAIGLNLTAAIEMGMRNVAQQRITRDMQTLGLAKQLKGKQKAEGGEVQFKVNGKNVRFDIYDPLVYESMQSVPELSGMVTTIFGRPASFLREMITRDPGFMAVNMLRDTLSTSVTSGSDFIPIVDTLRGAAQGMENLERTGVVGGYDYSNDPDDVVEFYQKEMRKRGLGPDGKRGGPLGMFQSVWDWAGEATTRSDAATRNAVYKDVLARTGNEAEAHFQALEVINFSRRGANGIARALTAAIPFLNARFQGLDVFWRAGKGTYSANSELSKRRAMQSFYTRAAMLSGLTMLYYSMVSDDEQYKEQSEHIRDNNWILPTSSGVPVKIPIPFEVGFFFKAIPETIMAAVDGSKSSREARETIQRGVVSTLEINPLGIQAISPLVEAAFNHSFYTGRDIVPYYMDMNVATGLQDRTNTTQIAKFIGSELGISPIKIDHVMTGYGGTIGGYVLSGVDALLRSSFVTGDDAQSMPSLAIHQYPMIKRFFASKEGSGLKEDAYDLYREINKVVTTANKLAKEGRREEFEAYLSTRRHLADLKKPVYSIKKQLDKARRERDAILRADIDPDLKREMLEDLDGNVNEYLKVVPDLKNRADLPAFESRFMQRLTGS